MASCSGRILMVFPVTRQIYVQLPSDILILNQNLHLHPIKYMLLDCMSKSNAVFLQIQSQQETVGSGGDNMESPFLGFQNIIPSRD